MTVIIQSVDNNRRRDTRVAQKEAETVTERERETDREAL